MSLTADSCCGVSGQTQDGFGLALVRAEELMHAGRPLSGGAVEYVFSLPDLESASAIDTIETALGELDGVVSARVNLTKRRVTVELESAGDSPLPLIETLQGFGYGAFPVDLGDLDDAGRQLESAGLLRALAVAGFAAANVMLLSVSVWSGAEQSTRDLFHLVSALIAIPAIAYSGQVFFRSALSALRQRALNMDVPISLAILLAPGMSIVETFNSGRHAYFDAAVTLLFFLLIGRYLDQLMRERARNAVMGLGRLSAKGAMLVGSEGEISYVPITDVEPGMVLRVAAGERIPVDAEILSGRTDLDRSLVTGESNPVSAGIGAVVEAGTLNITAPVDIRAVKRADQSYLAEVIRMMEAAERGRGRYVRVADAMARMYSPAVHVLAAASFAGWMLWTAGDWHTSITIAIAVLIITCPCALGLAVPVVHVIGASRLFENGIMMKDGSALERLALVTRVVFDKTGTLTTGTPSVVSSDIAGGIEATVARALAAQSTHPASRAILQYLPAGPMPVLQDISEEPGYGVEATWNGKRARLGRVSWVQEIAKGKDDKVAEGVGFVVEGAATRTFALAETLRADSLEAIQALKEKRFGIELLSGDNAETVSRIARKLAIATSRSNCTPRDKIARIEVLQRQGDKVMMVGDGLNDAPSLAAGDVSMAPASACDAGRMAADFVFTRDSLMAVPVAFDIATKANSLVKQNFVLAIGYNFIAVPLAVLGFVTPLVAAIAMSLSSVIVVANSLRLARGGARVTQSKAEDRSASDGRSATANSLRGRAA